MAPKARIPDSDNVFVSSAIVIKGYASPADYIIVPTETFEDTQFIHVNCGAQWLRKLYTGKQAYDQEMSLAVTNINNALIQEIEESRAAIVKTAQEERANLIKKIAAKAAALDIDDSDDDEPVRKKNKKDQTGDEKPLIVKQPPSLKISLLGTEMLVRNHLKTIRFEASPSVLKSYLQWVKEEIQRLRLIGIREKQKANKGMQSWVERQGVPDVHIPKVTGKVFYSPAQEAWNVRFTNAQGEEKCSTKDLRVNLSNSEGDALESVEQMVAIRSLFTAACDQWNTLDKSTRARLNAAEYL